ncbi:uncharacterized protein LOC120276192 [Dioscorea cayenensis subsp. rotundata]|uniref:Uncharacterized protein LOC120276192 n=1 Tax=Dioscorea cayennensis subsp. rotundata TaxID=55577 RepID=A0AB40CFV4_DIOCR|nr:uncharacterized protein LOC120276192 [Dioscorea cayenensis subsp. rotundata]
MEMTQYPIIGTNQSLEQLWSQVEEKYNLTRDKYWVERSARSLQCRMQTIEKAVKKLNGCIRQVENLSPSGASNEDIINRAKKMLLDDPNYKKGFKFDHVWHIVRNFEKFKDNVITSNQINRKHGFDYVSS